MAGQKGANKSQNLIKVTQALVLLLFVSLLAFSAGTYIGKKVSDSEHRRAQLEGEYQNVAMHSDEAQGQMAEATEDKLSDDEIASLTEEFVTKERSNGEMAQEEPTREVASSEESAGYKKYHSGDVQAPAPEETQSTEPKQMPASESQPMMASEKPAQAPVAKEKPVMPAANRVAEGKAPAPDAKEERKPMSILPSVSAAAVGKYTVQVASYADENEAKNHAANLKGKGWNAFYIPAEVQGKTWYRVSVGLFTTAKSATEFRKEFQKESSVATAIVQKIVK